MAAPDHTEYLVNGGVGGKGTVEDGELPLQTLRYVVTASSRLDHGCQKLQSHGKHLVLKIEI